jgi:hypothetical protein
VRRASSRRSKRSRWRSAKRLRLAYAAIGRSRPALIRLCLAAALAAVGAAAPAPAQPRALFVDGSSLGGRCSDARAAAAVTISTPWCSLAAAAVAAPPGSVVLVRQGTYPQLALTSYAPSSTVTFEGYRSEWPQIAGMSIGSSAAPASRHFTFEHVRFTDTVTLTNFADAGLSGDEIALRRVPPRSCVGPPRVGTCDVRTPDGLVLNPPVSNFNFDGNYVHDGDIGILTRQPGPLTPFRGVAVSHNRFTRMGGVVMHVYDAVGWAVSGNEFADDGIYQDIDPDVHPDAVHLVGPADGVLLDGNYVHSTVGGRGFLLESGSSASEQRNVVVENNVLAPDRDFGVRLAGNAPGLRVVNNTIWGTELCAGCGLDVQSRTTGAVIENNILRSFRVQAGTTKADHNLVARRFGGARSGRHDVRGDPRFVAAGRDFHLTARSPAIGAGNLAVAPPRDADGFARLFADLGAYVYRPGPSTIRLAVGRARGGRFRIRGAAPQAGPVVVEVDRRAGGRWRRARVLRAQGSGFALTLRLPRHARWRVHAQGGGARSGYVRFSS